MMIVSFEEELREAFAAGQRAGQAALLSRKKFPAQYAELNAEFLERTPKTYEEWIATKSDQPQIMRG